MKRAALSISLALTVASPAFATEAPAPSTVKANQKEDTGDSARIICRTVDVIGSRLSTKKVCATAAEWAGMKAEQRQGTEKMQQHRWTNGG
ncbi:MAG: hypothetical protein B7Z39_02115 [Novosphingobium sp. 12-64-8]|nr:MAG: hypothetical protein B7Z39_02115 [Novosphingobium sp. 12-64-8]